MTLHRHSGAVLEVAFIGDLDSHDATVFIDWLGRELDDCEDCALFLDFEEFRSYATEVRAGAQRLLLSRRDRWRKIHTLGGTKIVRMGISVANLALGGAVEAHSDRIAFEKQLALALEG